VAVVNHERRGQAEQRLGRQERDLPARRDRAARQQRPDLLPPLTVRQLQITGEVSHGVRLLPALSY
jgi:hypothetical protein